MRARLRALASCGTRAASLCLARAGRASAPCGAPLLRARGAASARACAGAAAAEGGEAHGAAGAAGAGGGAGGASAARGGGGQKEGGAQDDVPTRLLSLALDKVPAHGFTDAALVAAAEELGLSGAAATSAAPRGGIDLVEAFVARCDSAFDAALADDHTQQELADLSVRDPMPVAAPQ